MLVGREAEWQRVTGVLDGVRAGCGAALVLVGPPGMGKTALLDEAAAAAGGLRVLRATGVEFEARFAWGGVHQLLGPVLHELDGLPAEQAAALRAALRLGPATGDDPFLVALAVLTVLSQAAATTGLVCLLDDVQWLDDQSVDALRFVARRVAREPIGLLAAARDGSPGRLDGDPWSRLEVPALTASALARLLDRLAAGPVSPAVRQRLFAYAGGNPLALLEIVAAVSADQLAGRRPLPDPLPLSPGLEAAFLDQVRRTSPAAQDLLLVAAFADGVRWSHVASAARAIRATAAAGAPGTDGGGTVGVVDVSSVDGAAAELEAARLVTIGPAGVRFRHPLVRSAVRRAAPFTRRQAVHLALAAALTGDEHADRRAWHLAAACAGTDAGVADQLAEAARRARARGGFAAAATALERAAELSPVPADQGRRLVAAGEAAFQAGRPDRALRCAVRAGRAASGDPAVQGRVAALRGRIQLRAGQLADAVGTLRDGADAVAGTDADLALEMLYAATEAAGYAGAAPAVLDLAERARRIPAATPPARLLREWLLGIADVLSGDVRRGGARLQASAVDPSTLPTSRWLIWASFGAMYQSDIVRMVELMAAAARRARAAGALDDLPLALHGMSVVDTIRGRFPDARAAAEEGLRLARETGQDSAECLNLAALAALAALRGEEGPCRQHADSALAFGIPRGFGLAVARATWALAVLDLGAGRPEEAAARLRGLAQAGPGTGHFLISVYCTPDLVEALVRCGDGEAAARATTALEPVAAASDAPSPAAWLARCRGLTAEPAAAVGHFQEALRWYDRTEERFERARTELLLGEALRRAKRRTEARDTLRAALTSLAALDARDWAETARRELRAVGDAPPASAPPGLTALTPQELQIARLVSGGASNRAVAAALFLSPRTVEYHLYKVYPKLGVGSRTELARLLLTDGRS